jgi:histidinol-phosphate aminotransferase
MLAHPPVNDLVPALQALRASGIKLRDASSLGLPGWVRLRAMPPEARTDLAQAWRRLPVDMSPPLRQTHQEAA